MPAVMEQIGKMSRAEQIRIARLILESIENGEVFFGGEEPSAKHLNVGLMKDEISLPSDFDEAFGSLDKTIADELIGEDTCGSLRPNACLAGAGRGNEACFP